MNRSPDRALFDLPAPATTGTALGEMPYCWSYGMGVESTAGIVRTLLDPDFRSPHLRKDLSNLIVATAQTGDEWHSLGELVAQHVLPLLRRFDIRTVEVARAGPLQEDGIVLLQDTRHPERMHLDPVESGFFALSEEHRGNGVMPALGNRRCSQKAKGWPLDTWRTGALGDRPYLHAIGYNADEHSRIRNDSSITLGGRRHPVYPLHAAGWNRQRCSDYLESVFGVIWPKSACRQCCFVSRCGWPEQLDRFRHAPQESFPHVVDEYVCRALNRNTPLFGRAGTLTDRLAEGGATEVIQMAEQYMDTVPWAVYRVRRVYFARATAWRSIDILRRGPRPAMGDLLSSLATTIGVPVLTEGPHTRLWLAKHEPTDAYPHVEQFYVTAPASVHAKQRSRFDIHWAAWVPDRVRALALDASDYLDTTAAPINALTAA